MISSVRYASKVKYLKEESAVKVEAPLIPVDTVFVVDDDDSVRTSLDLVIRAAGLHPRLFASAHEFLAHPRCNTPACLVLDMRLPNLNGLDLQKRIVDDLFHIPIIFITGYRDVPMTVQAMKTGAFDFLTKPFDANELLNAIGKAIDRSKDTLRNAAEMNTLRGRFLSVTSREREVMDLLVSGLLNKEVADELGISLSTVKVHRGSIMRKMAAKSLADLVKMHAKLAEAPFARNQGRSSIDS